jgi:DNA-binding NarL/FixJ family response regulator
MIRVIIADDHPIVRSGIRTELQAHSDLHVVGETVNGDDTFELTRQIHPDVLLLDVNMPGLKVRKMVEMLRKDGLACKILVLSAYKDIATVTGMLIAGVDGYIIKGDDPHTIYEAIQSVVRGQPWYSPTIASAALAILSEANKTNGLRLTDRECQVVQCLMAGQTTNKQIAIELDIAERTVEFHISNLLQKLKVKSKTEIVIWASEHPHLTNNC